MSTPIGITNNNPLNIRYVSSIDWKGQTGSNKGFAVFKSMAYGYRAAIKNIQTYIQGGTNTIWKIVHRWAPASDGNNPVSYANNVSLRSGINYNKVIDKKDLDTLGKIVAAMSISEIGTKYPLAIDEAVQMLKKEQGLTTYKPEETKIEEPTTTTTPVELQPSIKPVIWYKKPSTYISLLVAAGITYFLIKRK